MTMQWSRTIECPRCRAVVVGFSTESEFQAHREVLRLLETHHGPDKCFEPLSYLKAAGERPQHPFGCRCCRCSGT